MKHERNLHQNSDAWTYDYARGSQDAQFSGNANISGTAQTFGNARVIDDAYVHGSAHPSREERLYAAVNTANTALCIRR